MEVRKDSSKKVHCCSNKCCSGIWFILSCVQTKMVQHIRKKHPEFAQLANTVQAPLATAVINSTPAVIATDSTATEAVVV